MLKYNFLPDLHCCGGRTNELDITAEIIQYIYYTLLYISGFFLRIMFRISPYLSLPPEA